jgi:hypothetical protein
VVELWSNPSVVAALSSQFACAVIFRMRSTAVSGFSVSAWDDRARLESQRNDLLVLQWAGRCRWRGQADVMTVLVQPLLQETDGPEKSWPCNIIRSILFVFSR